MATAFRGRRTPMRQQKKQGKVGLTYRGVPDVRLQPSERHITTSKSWRQALTTRDFGTGTRGFAASENRNVAVCVRPGTELSFVREITCQPIGILCGPDKVIEYKTAVFQQINKDQVAVNHDALEFPDGQIVLLTCLRGGQVATVLRLPAEPKAAVEVEAQRRAAFVG